MARLNLIVRSDGSYEHAVDWRKEAEADGS